MNAHELITRNALPFNPTCRFAADALTGTSLGRGETITPHNPEDSLQTLQPETTQQGPSSPCDDDERNVIMTHTPTPWTAYTDGPAGKATIEVRSEAIRSILATCYAGQLCEEHGGTSDANAAYMVRAVNAHAALVNALKELVHELDICRECDTIRDTVNIVHGPLSAARAALELAEKGIQ